MDTSAISGLCPDRDDERKECPMEPIHAQALLNLEGDREARFEQIERYFAVRAAATQRRRRRLQRLRQRLVSQKAPRPVAQPAV